MRLSHTRRYLPVVAVFLAVMTVVPTAPAHDRTASYSQWHFSPQRIRIVLNVSEVDAAACLPVASGGGDAFAALAGYAANHLVLLADGQPCRVIEAPRPLEAPAGRWVLEWSVVRPDHGTLRIRSSLFVDRFPGHLHFASLRRGGDSVERVLTRAEPSWDIGAETGGAGTTASPSSLGRFWMLGVEHIATGYDHLAFLLALLLLGGGFRSLVKVVSGFTVGHSITLGCAALGLLKPAIGPIEALIGLSIVLVAVENVWLLDSRRKTLPLTMVAMLLIQAGCAAGGFGRVSSLSFLGFALFLSCYYPLLRRSAHAGSSRWVIASIFGLVHGFAFASVLQAASIPPDRLPGVLVSFNIGVETGQIVIVAAVWPLLRIALAHWGSIVVETGSAVALALGLYWLVVRAYT